MHMALFCVPNMSYNICDKCRVSEHKQMSSTHKKINQGVVLKVLRDSDHDSTLESWKGFSILIKSLEKYKCEGPIFRIPNKQTTQYRRTNSR